MQDGIKHLMTAVNMEPDQWQLGKTKVFVKSPESVRSCECLQHVELSGGVSATLSAAVSFGGAERAEV